MAGRQAWAYHYGSSRPLPGRDQHLQGVTMRAGTIRLTPVRILAAFAALSLLAVAVSAQQAPATTAAAAKPAAGDVAPAFNLVDQDGKKHALSDYKGKWVVVYFYPKDQTPGCTTQACQFTENVFAFRRANAQFLGSRAGAGAAHWAWETGVAGIDKSSAERRKAVGELGVAFPLLADASFVAAVKYGVLPQRGRMDMGAREAFLID